MTHDQDFAFFLLPLQRRWPMLLIGVAFLLGVPARIAFGWGMPLWFDETYSAVIASQPDLSHLTRWCLSELTGPGYYGALWAWARLFGTGDLVLRLPSLLCSIAAPLIILRWGHPDRVVRLFWCAILLLWLPALVFANDARPYAELVLFAILQGIAFLQMMRVPTTRHALLWIGISTVSGLTHYYGLPITAIQGVLYLAIWRRRAVATWPGLAPALLLAGWMSVHLPFVLHFSSGHAAAYAPSPPGLLLTIPALVFGTQLQGVLLLVLMAAASALLWRVKPVGDVASSSMPERMLILSGVLALALLLGLALIRAGFAARYLTPLQPALLFGVAWWARWMIRRSVKPVIALFVLMGVAMAGAFVSAVRDRSLDDRHLFNLEQPSAWLMQRDTRRLVFVWADPVGILSVTTPDGRARTAEVGGFFFRRAGRPIAVVVPRLDLAAPSAEGALALAGTEPHSAILWIANDLNSPAHVRPRLAQRGWECRDFGEKQVTVIACRRAV
jgi:hypothetical protein